MKVERKWNKNLFLIILPLMVILGKIIRWTILKSVLVDMSIGNGMISKIINGSGWFTSLAETGISDAAGNASVFFRLINFFGLTTTVQFEIYISIIWNMILIFLIKKCKPIMNTMEFLFVSISIAVLNIWDFCLAKEPMQLLFFLIIALILFNKKLSINLKYFLTILVLVITVLYYRVYYILIILFLIIVSIVFEKYIIKQKKITKKTIIKVLILLAFIYFIMLNVIKIIDISSYNELIRVRTRSGLANTQMLNLFKSTNLILFSVDYFIMIIRMMFPVELIPMGIKYWPYAFYQILISYFVIKNVTHLKKLNKTKKLALYLYIAFLLSSATFEPDFGSWIRHEAAIIPILLIITNAIEVNDVGENDEKRIDKKY